MSVERKEKYTNRKHNPIHEHSFKEYWTTETLRQ